MKVFNVFCLLFCRYTAFFFGPKCIPQYFDIRWNRSEIGWFWPVIVRDKMVASTILLCMCLLNLLKCDLYLLQLFWRRCTHLKHFSCQYVWNIFTCPNQWLQLFWDTSLDDFPCKLLRELHRNCTSQMKGEHGWTRNGASAMIFSTTRMGQFAARIPKINR